MQITQVISQQILNERNMWYSEMVILAQLHPTNITHPRSDSDAQGLLANI